MPYKSLNIIIVLLSISSVFAKDKIIIPRKMLDEYKTFSLGKCINTNYAKMGIDFNKVPLHDNTYGYIDIDAGLGFYSKRNNVLARYIEEKTGDFYKPSTQQGDLASANMVMYKCVDFFHSRALDAFLRKILYKRLSDIANDTADDED